MGIWRALDEALGYLFIYAIFFEGILVILCNVYSMFVPVLSLSEIFSSVIIGSLTDFSLNNVVKVAGFFAMCIICVINALVNKKIKEVVFALIMFFVVIAMMLMLPLFISKLITYNFDFYIAFLTTLKFFINTYIISWLSSLLCFILINIIIFYIARILRK